MFYFFILSVVVLSSVPQGAESDNVITMGSESIGFAAVSSLYCPRDYELACLDIERYNYFKETYLPMFYGGPENYALIWALGVLGINPCINLINEDRCPENTFAFGIFTNCKLCLDNGYGWCREAYNSDENGTIHERSPPFAPVCVDHSKMKKCPYINDEPITSTSVLSC